MLAAAVRASEQRVLAIECNRADGPFDDVGIDLDATVVDEVLRPYQRANAYRIASAGLVF